MKDLSKPGDRAVIGLFHFRRKETAGKLVTLQVIGKALTALALSGAGFIGTGAFGFINFYLTLHSYLINMNNTILVTYPPPLLCQTPAFPFVI